MPVEVLIEEYKKNRKVIVSAMQRQDEIIEKIKNLDEDDKDMISVKSAAILLDCSPQFVYQLRDSDKLKKIKYVGSKVYVSRSEIEQINDKPRFK
ncbi:MAG: helix-turn-helix domain-containing protein [Treponema sp.]|nr:helix-turn-helix domain-containing protein [Treponema sp.]